MRMLKKCHKLSYQEKRVLKLLAQNNNEIAFQLCVSANTVKTYVQRILIKLNVKNRTSAVITSINEGILRADDFKLELSK